MSIVALMKFLINVTPKEKLDKIGQPSRFPGLGIANLRTRVLGRPQHREMSVSFRAGKTSYLLITKLGLLIIKMLDSPRLSNFVQFHWTPVAATE